MPKTSPSYRGAVWAGSSVAPLLGLFNAKLAAGDRARRAGGKRLIEWAARARDPHRPLVWFHASSVGEGLQAESVIRELRQLRPDAQWVYTHFSPSALPLARRLPVDAADFLPYDRPGNAARLLDAIRPDLLVFSKLDLWPELATRAASRGTSVAMVAGTVSSGSGRLRWPARPLLRPGYASLTAAGAISAADGARLIALGAPGAAVRVLGDPRFDSVESRILSISREDPLLVLGQGGPAMVAGSTWAADERVLLTALRAVRARHPGAHLIVVPHEPTPAHLQRLSSYATGLGLPPPVPLSRTTSPAPLLVVERIGVLATLYAAGIAAYVGGGFGRAGLHSVLEPAALAVPVAFGPRWDQSRDAELLLASDAASVVSSADTLAQVWSGWLENEERRVAMGRRARAVVEAGLGAARRSAEMLDELISLRHPRM